MTTILQITRRESGSPGAPSSAKSGQLFYNMVDGKFYVGYGDDGSGNATSVKVFATDSDPTSAYQPKNTELTGLAALSANGIAARTASGTYTSRTITGTSGDITVSNGDGVSGNPTIDLATVSVGSTVTGGSTKFTYDSKGRITNAGQASLTDLSAPSASFGFNGQRLTNLADPTSAQDGATKNYVDGIAQGVSWKNPVLCATTASITLSGEQTIDGITTSASRILVKNQSTASANGIYVTASGAWSRSTDAATWAELNSAAVLIEEGSTQADTAYVCTSDPGGTLGTTSVAFVQFGNGSTSYSAGNGISIVGSTISASAGTGITVSGGSIALSGQALALNNVTTATDNLIYATGSGTFSTVAFNSVARTLISQTSQSSMRSTGLGLGDMATQTSSSVAITGGTISGVTIDGGTF